MSSISFDPLAPVYDAIRGYPPTVASAITAAIDQAVGGNTQTRFLEVGVGTGRFAFPLAEAEHQCTGIDISEKMMSQLKEKLCGAGWQEEGQRWGKEPDEDATQNPPVQRFTHMEKQGSMRLVRTDMTALPFHDDSFDVVIASHVFHVVRDWHQALKEIMRVSRPGGVFIRCWNANWQEAWKPGSGDIRREWSRIVEELGGSTAFVGTAEQSVTTWLQGQGFETEQREILTWQRQVTPRALFESVVQYQGAGTWPLSDDLFEASLTRLSQWVEEHYREHVDEAFLQEEHLVLGRTLLGE
ncbi:methyltransferase domain-containing protein [Ktedonosporobacter rubrisoli]|uniref:Methyltransferase domain-containing protein n=1 Tax=Ktedonosporobacter rubrisoli TaxID=2509675 RepID=A0A4P6K254_KTERU|nr:class I SAM-dependent methyltransferase [Ktedonosporobacter rubrisoli]QBD81972.1 methyltransferase domain-containing protein [Ktedonosporobacter rubrisoli]